MSEYKVVNPAANETERGFATATDAEVGQVLERSAQAVDEFVNYKLIFTPAPRADP